MVKKSINYFIKERSIINIVLLLVILLQSAFLLYSNFCLVPNTLDNDAAKSMVHAIEIWNQKTVFLNGWSMMTTLETGTPTFIAVFIYGLTHNIIASYAVANIIITILFVIIMVKLLSVMKVNSTGKLTVIALFLTPLSFGQLLYYNMMLFAAGAYSIRIIIIMLMLLLFTFEKQSPEFYAWLVFTCLLCFLCGISTGVYVVMTTLLPTIVVFFILKVLKREHIYSDWLSIGNIVSYCTVFAAFIGMCVQKLKGLSTKGMELDMVKKSDFFTNLMDTFTSWFELYGAFPYNSMSIMSLSGIGRCFHFVTALLALIAFVIFTAKGVRILLGKNGDGKEDTDSLESMLYAMVTAVSVVNILITILSGAGYQCRYLLLVMVPGLLFFGKWISNVKEYDGYNAKQHKFMALCFGVIIVMLALFSDYQVILGDGEPNMQNIDAKLEVVLSKLNEYPEKEIIFLGDEGSPETLRLLDYDSDREYTTYVAKEDNWNGVGVNVHDYYMGITDASNMDDANLLIVNTELASIDDLPDYISKDYEKIDEYQNFEIYRSPVNLMDGVTGYQYNDNSVDYCYSREYEILSGEIDDEGMLSATGQDDYILSSPLLGDASGELTVTMNYLSMSKGDIGKIEVWDVYSAECLVDEPIDGESIQHTISGISLNGRNLVIKVYLCEGKDISIESFEFEKK